jgi:hypothetical protein
MPNFSGIIQLAGFGGGNTDGDSPMSGASPAEVSGVADGESPMSGGSPAETGGVSDGDSPMIGGSNVEIGGVGDGDSPMIGGSNAEIGGVGDGDSPMGGAAQSEAIVGNVMGVPADGSDRPSQGGVGVRVAGLAFSEREEIDLVTDMPGIEISGQDIAAPVADARAEARFRIAGEVEIARLTLAPLSGPAPQIVFTPSGLQARLITTRVLAVALDVTGVVTQPEIDLRKTVLGDVLAQVALGFTATGQCSEFACGANRLVVDLGEDLQLGVPVTGAATTYSVQLIILGRVVPA